ncbi:hypothetical protein ACKFKG_04910 [Phormidesmis sp. 146-35]
MWEEIIEDLADRIFWDRDWQVSSRCLHVEDELLDSIEEEFSQLTGLDEAYMKNRLPRLTRLICP